MYMYIGMWPPANTRVCGCVVGMRETSRAGCAGKSAGAAATAVLCRCRSPDGSSVGYAGSLAAAAAAAAAVLCECHKWTGSSVGYAGSFTAAAAAVL
jgi:hypothetical protein